MSLSPLFLAAPHLPWWLDATAMHLDEAALDALPWDRVHRDVQAQEAGEPVNVDETRAVGHTWLRATQRAPTLAIASDLAQTLSTARDFAVQARQGTNHPLGLPFTDVLHVGIGGSQLGPALLIDALTPPQAAPGAMQVHFVDNTDPDGVHRTLTAIGPRLATTLVLVISKSGGTAETMNGLDLTERAMRAAGLAPHQHLVAITVPGSKLSKRVASEGWLAEFPLYPFIGGRFSVTSVAGLLTAELAGLDTGALLAGAADMDAWTRNHGWRDNPAALLAGSWHVAGHGRGDRAMVVLPYSDRLILLSRYLQQLVMESLGKRTDRQGAVVEQGLTVYGNKGSTDQHAFVQQLRDGRNDAFTLFVQVLGGTAPDPILHDDVSAGDYLQGFLLGTRRALGESDRPTLTLTVPAVTPYTLGGLIALFERSVGVYASLVDINAYHQPGVEAGKRAANGILDLSRAVRAALASGPADLQRLAHQTDADPLELLYILQRLAAAGRVVQQGALTGTYALAPVDGTH